jgi:nucleoside-diphosphate-sugar epimerase
MSSFWKDKSVLVTGGGGFIGSHLVERLLQVGAKVAVVDDLKRGNAENLKGSGRHRNDCRRSVRPSQL